MMSMMRRTTFALLLALAGASGCGSEPPTEPGLDTPLRTFDVIGWVIDMVFTPGGDSLVVGSNPCCGARIKPARRGLTPPLVPTPWKRVTVLSFADGGPLRTLDLPIADLDEATAMVFTRDRKHVLVAGYFPRDRELRELPERYEWSFLVSTVSMVRIEDGVEVRAFEGGSAPEALDLTPNGDGLVAAVSRA